MPGLLNIRGNDADVRHARENAFALVAAIDAVFFRRPDFQQDAETVARVEESDRVPRLVSGKNVRRRGDLLQAGGSQVCNVIDDVRGVQANVVERANAAARLNEAMHSCALCRCGVQFKLGMADGNINDVRGVCPALLASARQGRANCVHAQPECGGEYVRGPLNITDGDSGVVNAVKHVVYLR